MKRILIIGSKDSGSKNNPTVLADSLRNNGVDTMVIFWEDLSFTIKTSEVHVSAGTVRIADYEAELVVALGWYKTGSKSYYRDVAYSLALYLRHHDIPFWNSEMAHQRSVSKLSCMVELALANISVPDTVFYMDTSLLQKTDITLPVVVKAAAASRGEFNYFVHTFDEVMSKAAEGTPILIQPFLENDHDLRVICFGGKPAKILKRSRSAGANTHLNNTSQGGSAVWLALDEVPSSLLTEAEKICSVMNRELAGIDFIPDASASCGYSCLEVNAIPQLTSGVDADKKLESLAAYLVAEQRSNQ